VLGKRSITDLPTVLILAATLLLLWKAKKVPEPAIVAIAALAGLVIYPLARA
jgi:chromate transporter